ncbi:hypothetical protein D9Q98_006092 [Chlorella vulgaris]|uniref:Peptidase S8/S53 domain-containing protein n=1 Tax=Chlorella vulgaris TaxID=3077 RepID=A0A9D4TWX9_CHLVU|nr:hypothetical protein D9Q98_006092 [Chlorella vulgaris]
MARPSRGAGGLAGCIVVLLASILFCRPASAARDLPGNGQGVSRIATGRLIVKLRPDVVSVMDSDANGLRFAGQVGLTNAAVYSILDGTDVHEKAKQVSQLPAVEFAEPDYLVRVDWQPDDTLVKTQWHLDTIHSQNAWNTSTGSREVKVCHIDSGIEVNHPDLHRRMLKGWNLVPEVQEFDEEPPAPTSEAYGNVDDTYGHGTHTAGIIAAVGNNQLGVAGVAMNVRLLVCRFIWDDGFGSISDALECLRLCREEGAMVSTSSWGGVPHSMAIDAALAEAKQAGMLFVVASGNQGTDLDARPSFPASSQHDNVIVVGSSSRTDEMSTFSNYGKGTVHLLAPGEGILSTTYNSWYGPMDGTSMACPMVAASAALLHSAALGQGTVLTYTQIKRLLLSTVNAVPCGKAATLTGGRLNIGTAMQALSLMLQDQGGPALPGVALTAADEAALRKTVGLSVWGQELLLPSSVSLTTAKPPAGPTSAAAQLPGTAGPPPAPRPASPRQDSSSSGTSSGIISGGSGSSTVVHPEVQAAAYSALDAQEEVAAPAPAKLSDGRRLLRLSLPSG